MPRRTVTWTACLLLPLLAGCFSGYAYPTLSFVPPVALGAASDEVHAFRVDVADQRNCLDFGDRDRYVLHPMPLRWGDHLTPQLKVAVDYGWVWNCAALVYTGSTRHTLMVRLYRPGYHTVEVHSWQLVGKGRWVPAENLEAQEKAIDDLVSTWGTDFRGWLRRPDRDHKEPPRDSYVFNSLASGAAGPGHRHALRFAISEYERLAEQAWMEEQKGEMYRRLTEKASALRKLADCPYQRSPAPPSEETARAEE
jgi:hypothetical protein